MVNLPLLQYTSTTESSPKLQIHINNGIVLKRKEERKLLDYVQCCIALQALLAL